MLLWNLYAFVSSIFIKSTTRNEFTDLLFNVCSHCISSREDSSLLREIREPVWSYIIELCSSFAAPDTQNINFTIKWPNFLTYNTLLFHKKIATKLYGCNRFHCHLQTNMLTSYTNVNFNKYSNGSFFITAVCTVYISST